MTNVLYIPLDERACNYRFPQQLAQMTGSIRLLTPPESIMGYRKNPADCEALWQWLFDHVQQCEYAILSVDTLVYGNILNSRLHHRTIEDCERLLDNFRKLKSMNPSLEIHAFSIVARVAAYNGSMEDPDYWETHGRDIWRYTILRDKLSRGESTAEERKEYTELVALIPAEYLNDFLARRKVDRAVNQMCIRDRKKLLHPRFPSWTNTAPPTPWRKSSPSASVPTSISMKRPPGRLPRTKTNFPA